MKSKQKTQDSSAQMAQSYRPVQPTTFNPEQAQGVGWSQVPQTFTPEAKPAWMTGVWDMPSWGMDAVTGQPLGQEQVQAQAYQPPVPEQAPAPRQAQGVFDPRRQYDLYRQQMEWENRRNDMRMQEGTRGLVAQQYNPAFSPMAMYERQQRRMQKTGLAEHMAQQEQAKADRMAAIWSQLGIGA
jgi:hypothetical protein